MQAHSEPNMSVKGYDIWRLNNLLPAGRTITEAAKIMNVSVSTAQRLKGKIHQTIDSQIASKLRWGVQHA
jgi:transposase